MEKTMFKLGPKAMKGTIWDEKGHYRIVEIKISHQQDSINSIQFTYCSIDENQIYPDIVPSKIFGEPCGLKFNTISLDSDEFLVSLSGEYDKDGKLVSIVFGTNKTKYGPFGRTRRTGGVADHNNSADSYDDFCYEFGPRDCFGGFHGSVDNGSLRTIGVYVRNYEQYEDERLMDGCGVYF